MSDSVDSKTADVTPLPGAETTVWGFVENNVFIQVPKMPIMLAYGKEPKFPLTMTMYDGKQRTIEERANSRNVPAHHIPV